MATKAQRKGKSKAFYRDEVFVRLEVGRKATVFTIHKSLLVSSSPYFEGALNGSFKEASANKICMEEDDPRIVECFVSWLYTKRIDDALLDDPGCDKEDWYKHAHHRITTLAEVYDFADTRIINGLQDHVIFAIAKEDIRDRALPIKCFQIAFRNTRKISKLANFAMDWTINATSMEDLVREVEGGDLPEFFFLYILQHNQFRRRSNGGEEWKSGLLQRLPRYLHSLRKAQNSSTPAS